MRDLITQHEKKSDAENKFQEMVDSKMYSAIFLIRSDHWASEGYWVKARLHEFKLPNLGEFDYILKTYRENETN